MKRGQLRSAGNPIAAALAASDVGTWEWDIEHDVARCCPATARMFGFSPEEGIEGIPERSFTSRVVLEDRESHAERLRHALKTGGLFVTEYRTEPEPGRINWLLIRGRFQADGDGFVRHARGIVIDVTESRESGQLDGCEFFVSDMDPIVSPLARAADHALALWKICEKVAIDSPLDIEVELRSVLMKIARGLSREAMNPTCRSTLSSNPH